MQKALIIIEEHNFNNKLQKMVNSRDLYKFLQSQQDFSTWIKSRLFDFIENDGYIKLHKKMELSKTGQIGIEYYLTIETAKHIAMIEKNDNGKKIRQYFIDFEENAKQQLQNLSRKQILQMALEAEEKLEILQIENQQQSQIIEKYIKIDKSKNYTETAKILGLHPNKFIDWLKYKYITLNRTPYTEQIKNGRFEVKKTIKMQDDKTEHFESYLITAKGFDYFFEKVKKGELDFCKIINK